MKKPYRWACLALVAAFAFSSVAGCHRKETDETSETTETTEVTTEVTDGVLDEETDETSETSEWADPDKAFTELPRNYKEEALEIAAKVGLTEDDLRGEYEYFIQFAESVDGNPSLYEYEGYVYQLFPMIADNVDEENKEYFLDQLKNLVIEEGDPGNASAYYAIANNYVLIGGWVFNEVEECASLTVYHELIHFIDGSIDGYPSDVAVLSDGSIVDSAELTEEQKADVAQYVDANFLVEGGAEHYVSKYFASSFAPPSYYEITAFSIALEYIIGTERYDSMFFDSNTTYEFFKLLEEYGYTDDEIIKVVNGLNQMQYGETVTYNKSDMINPQEVLIKMYEEKFGTDYKDDLLFCELFSNVAYEKYFTNLSPYPKKFTQEMRDEWKQIVADEYGVEFEDIGLMNYPTPIFVGDEIVFGSIFDVFYRNDFGRTEGGLFQFTYDFDKDEMIEYSTKECDWIPGEVNDKFKNEKSNGAKELIESLKVDNSEAHDQQVTGNAGNLKDQYEKAATIGSEHGVYIWFSDLTPKGLLKDDRIATDPAKIDAALSEIEEVLDLYPEDYFDQLLFEYYKGFAICLYEGDYDQYLRGSYCVNGDYYMIINISISNPSLNGFYGADTVRNMGFNSVSIMKTQLICEIWKCTEKFFANYNSHFEEPTKGNDSWKKVNEPYFTYTDIIEDQVIDLIMGDDYDWDYFLCRECVTFKTTDRCLLYEYVMLCAMTDSLPDLTPECEKKVNELEDEIRHFFDTDEWPDETTWESVV